MALNRISTATSSTSVLTKIHRKGLKLALADAKRSSTSTYGYRILNSITETRVAFVGTTTSTVMGSASPIIGRPWSTTNPDTEITVIEESETGATLILNLDSRNINSLPRTAAPSTWFDLTANANHATIYGGNIAYGQQGGQFCAVFPGGDANYAQAKSGVYFDGNSFTIQSWVYVTAVLNWNRIIDFGNGANANNILLSNTFGTTGKPGIYIEGSQFQST